MLNVWLRHARLRGHAGAGTASTAAATSLQQAVLNASFVSVRGKLPGAQRIPALGEPRTAKEK